MLIAKNICKELSDAEIIEKSIENIDYFSCLYDRYENKLLRYIKQITKLPDEEAEDILQEAFIKIWKNIHDFDQNLKLSSWIYRIVHNETISFWRKHQSFGKNKKVELDDSITDDMEENIDFEAERERMLQLTTKILNQIPLKYREVLILKFFEKMSYEEISDILKIPEGTVATRINRAKKAFKKMSNNKNISFDF